MSQITDKLVKELRANVIQGACLLCTYLSTLNQLALQCHLSQVVPVRRPSRKRSSLDTNDEGIVEWAESEEKWINDSEKQEFWNGVER